MDKKLVLQQAIALRDFYKDPTRWAHGTVNAIRYLWDKNGNVLQTAGNKVCIMGGIGMVCDALDLDHDAVLEKWNRTHTPSEREIWNDERSAALAREFAKTARVSDYNGLVQLNDNYGYDRVMMIINDTIARLCEEIRDGQASSAGASTEAP